MQQVQPFLEMYVDIVACCNARCPWCDTGMRKNGTLPDLSISKKKFMEPHFFMELIAHLRSVNLITDKTIVYPYNYGEAFLHPKFELFLQVLEGLRQPYTLSTNGSIVPNFYSNLCLNYLQSIIFSMPGFSQNSYDNIHGFKFGRIKSNITKILKLFRERQFRGIAEIHFHQYKFNIDEQKPATQFAFHNGMQVRVNTAIPVAQEVVLQYLSGTLDACLKKKMQEHMDLDDYKESLGSRPKDFQCAPKRFLIISSTGQLLRCCCMGENYPGNELGDVMHMNAGNIAEALTKEHPLCKSCISKGADYFMTGWPSRKILQPEIIESIPERTPFLTKDSTWLWLLDDDEYISKQVKEDCYEKLTTQFLRSFIKEGDVCIDVGANIGVFTTLFAKLVGHDGHVYAYEPSNYFHGILEHTVRCNGLRNVTIFPFGLSNQFGHAVLLQNNVTGGQCFPSASAPVRQDTIELRTLDEHILSLSIEHIDVLKIDVDGHEPYVLGGALKVINKYNPVIVLEMSHLHYFLEGTTAWDFYHWLKNQYFHIYHENGRKIESLQDFLVFCSNFNQVCNIILTRFPLKELQNLRKTTRPKVFMQSACNICGCVWFGTAPGGKLLENNILPRCLYCGSPERC